MDYGSDEWIALAEALEKERTDMTHADRPLTDEELNHIRYAQGKRQLRQKGEELEAMREQRDKLFFNAGRFAGGARDEVAVMADKVIQALMESEE
jgi:hypothetical protein